MLPDLTPPCPACGEPNAATLAWQLVDEEGRELLRCGCGHIFAVESAAGPDDLQELIERATTVQLSIRLQCALFEDLRPLFNRLKRRFQHRQITPRTQPILRLPFQGAVEC